MYSSDAALEAHGRARRRAHRVVAHLGSGANGRVRAALCLDPPRRVALKSVPRATADPSFPARHVAVAAVPHPHVVRVFEVFQTADAFYVSMEQAEGDLAGLVARRWGLLPMSDIREVLRGVLSGLAHLHSHGIAHRDVKPGNVLLRRLDDPSSVALGDFDFASGPTAPGDPLLRTFVGTPFYLAPEILRGDGYGPTVDVFAAGCIAYELTCGKTPFEDSRCLADVYRRILAADWAFPAGAPVPEALRDLVARMLEADPGRRTSAAEALRHPFFRSPERVRRRSPSGARVTYDEATGALLLAQRRPGSRCEEQMGDLDGSPVQRGRQVWA
ncbi:kinase-like domain-containing protein [Hyaloraphidium curvatum]|nr:kinase-like domain-containing protein [Hyaloraphidium curvatum]